MKSKSKDYEIFLNHYFTGNPMIRGRREEDTDVWNRLRGDELEMAKVKIINSLKTQDRSYIYASGIFKDDRAIKPLMEIADNAKYLDIKLYAAKVLFDWIGYDNYFELLNKVFTNGTNSTKTDLAYWISGLEEKDALKYFWKAMNDPDGFVRYCSYGALESYYGIWKVRKDGFHIKYFTDKEVYENKELFESRQAELKKKIKTWKKTKHNTV